MLDADLPGLGELVLTDYVLVHRDVLAEYVRDRVQRAVMATRAEYDTSPLMTVQQVAERLSVSEQMVGRLAKAGELKGVRIGRRWCFRREVVEGFVQAGEPVTAALIGRQRAASHDEAFQILNNAAKRNGRGSTG